jgi:bifunctional oligoribonuclease and PAP phosphatase NrnA
VTTENNKITGLDDPRLRDTVESNLKKTSRIVIISHVNPDGDAVGSSLALYHYFRKTGKDVKIVIPDPCPDFLKWLPGNDQIIIFKHKKKEAAEAIESAELLIALDFNAPSRAGMAEDIITRSGAFRILIDHHPNPSDFADIIISDTLASSTAELVLRFIELAGEPELIDNVIATCLYAGIMSDTGSFNYNSSQPETYRVLAELLKQGIDKDFIYSMVYDNYSENRMRLLGYCLLEKMVVLPDHKTAYISLSLKEKKQYNYLRGDAEGFVNYPLSIRGIVFVAFFMENDDHVKLSFRSKGSFDTNKFAQENFDGGGHINASGGESKLSLPEAINKFVSLLPHYITR